jgi:hypothetical protein
MSHLLIGMLASSRKYGKDGAWGIALDLPPVLE